MTHRDEDFLAFVDERRSSLLRTSTALTAGDPHLAEDLVQKCLIKLYLAWPRIRSMHLDGYVRRSLVNALIDERRRAFHRHERAWAEPPDGPGREIENAALSGDLLWALGQLAPRMRAAVVLRHVDGLTVEEAAHALRCSSGTVKSQTARGLDRLRALLAERPDATAQADQTNEREPLYQGEQRHD